jgi:hypothetical protein
VSAMAATITTVHCESSSWPHARPRRWCSGRLPRVREAATAPACTVSPPPAMRLLPLCLFTLPCAC